jgi:hypothetical protein
MSHSPNTHYNNIHEKYRRVLNKTLEREVNKLSPQAQRIFRIMYGHSSAKTNTEVIQSIPEDKLAWVFQQVENTPKKNEQ